MKVLFFLLTFILPNCGKESPDITLSQKATKMTHTATSKTDSITLGGGCFWCVEAVFQRVKGIQSVVSGYSGGKVENPTYRQVTTGTTGHAEVVRLVYDPGVISFTEILEIFFSTHDPTTLNRQGADTGTQYRSVIFYHHDDQRQTALKAIAELNQANVYEDAIVTEVAPVGAFYSAEDYHQNYYNDNSRQPYCQFVIRPKIEKIEKVFKTRLKH